VQSPVPRELRPVDLGPFWPVTTGTAVGDRSFSPRFPAGALTGLVPVEDYDGL